MEGFKAGHFTDWVRQRVSDLVGEDRFLTDGFRVQTTIDYELQKIAEEAVLKGAKEIDKRQGFLGPRRTLNSKEEIIEALNKADIWFAKETSKNSMHLMKEKEKDLFYSNYERTLFNYAGHKITGKESSILWNFVKNTKSSLKLFDDAESILSLSLIHI